MKQWLTRREAAQYLRLSHRTLEKWSWLGVGPEFHRLGRRIVYDREELDAFAARGRRTRTYDDE
jgi:excisionase family DNA binding protein